MVCIGNRGFKWIGKWGDERTVPTPLCVCNDMLTRVAVWDCGGMLSAATFGFVLWKD